MKRPAFQFYPADWRKDAALQSCSLAAQGLWMNMICIAHECTPYGHLTINGKPMAATQIARLVGVAPRECERMISELLDAGVVAITDEMSDHGEGVFYSRRMVRDEDLRNKRAEGGKAGSEHGIKGAEHGSKGGRPKKVRGVSKPPSEPPPSSSSYTSVYSVPNGTGGKPPAESPEDEKRELYSAGKSLLELRGMPKAQCGSFITRLCKTHGQDVALEAVRSAVAAQPLEATEYLVATCQRLKGERKDPVTTPGESTEEYVARKAREAAAEKARPVTAPPKDLLALARSALKAAA